jgi:1-acyl-sn-glycerol-3-phosphate acyltransferase
MAEIKPQVYKDARPAEYFTRFHERARKRKPGWVYDVVRIILTPIALLFYREGAIASSNVPETGAVILAPNHFSNMDHFFAGVYIRRRIQFMAKSQLFGNPILNFIFSNGGVFPIRRGQRDEEAFITAHSVFARQGCVLMYAEGGRSRSGGLGEPKPGVGRLALESGVPVVPVAIHGSLGVRRWKRLNFPKVTVQYAEPMTFPVVEHPTREQQQQAAEQIFARVREMYEVLDAEGRSGAKRAWREKAAAKAERAAAAAKLPAGQVR